MQVVGRREQRLDDEGPDVSVADVQVLGVECRGIEESIGLLPGNGGIGQITRASRGLGGVHGNAWLQAVHPAFGPGTSRTGIWRAPRKVGRGDVEESIGILVRRAVVDAEQALV